MAQINFPSAPTNGQEFTDQNGTVWVYETNKWRAQLMANIAANVGIVDAGGYYTSDDVEGALQEAGADVDAAQATADGAVTDAAAAASDAADASAAAATADGKAVTAQSMANAAAADAAAASNEANQAQIDADAADANANTRVLKSGDTMTGGLVTTAPYTAITLKDELSRNQRLAWVDENDNTFWRFERQNSGNFILARFEPAGTYANAAFIARPEGSLDLGQNTSVAVPDATTDGQALAHSQSGAVLDGLTATNSITLASAAPIVVFDETDVGDDSGKTHLRAFSGNFYFRKYLAAGGGAYRDSIRMMADGSLELHQGLLVTVPDPTSAASEAIGHAAKVVAFDSVTGRYATQGPNGVIEQGDTGWRDVTADLLNGWESVSGPVLLRRTGNTVELGGYVTNPTDVATDILQLPFGFHGGNGTTTGPFGFSSAYDWANGDHAAVVFINNGAVTAPRRPTLVTGMGIRVLANWVTPNTWPTSLPGTPL